METVSSEQRESDPTDLQEGKHRGGLTWLVWCPLFLLIYILSAGPVARLAFHGSVPLQAYYVVYSPLQTACEHCQPLENLVNWYVFDVWKARRAIDGQTRP
jgi:hypothetical protein